MLPNPDLTHLSSSSSGSGEFHQAMAPAFVSAPYLQLSKTAHCDPKSACRFPEHSGAICLIRQMAWHPKHACSTDLMREHGEQVIRSVLSHCSIASLVVLLCLSAFHLPLGGARWSSACSPFQGFSSPKTSPSLQSLQHCSGRPEPNWAQKTFLATKDTFAPIAGPQLQRWT